MSIKLVEIHEYLKKYISPLGINIDDEFKNKFYFYEINDIDFNIINLIRRTIIEETSIMCFDGKQVNLVNNSTIDSDIFRNQINFYCPSKEQFKINDDETEYNIEMHNNVHFKGKMIKNKGKTDTQYLSYNVFYKHDDNKISLTCEKLKPIYMYEEDNLFMDNILSVIIGYLESIKTEHYIKKENKNIDTYNHFLKNYFNNIVIDNTTENIVKYKNLNNDEIDNLIKLLHSFKSS